MRLNSDAMEDKFEKAKALELLRSLQADIDYKLIALKKQSLLRAAIARIPWISKFLTNVDDTAETIVKIGERVSDVANSFGNESISHGFHIGGIVVAAFDFIRIPLIYLAAYMLDEKIPFKLTNNAKWIYASFLLALTITAVSVPATAPIIAFVAAGTGLGLGVFLLARTLYQRYELGKERKSLKTEIESAQSEMDLIQDKAKQLETMLLDAKEEDHIIAILQEVALVQEQYNSQKSLLEKLKNRELHVEQKIQNLGAMRIVDKSIGIGLTCISIIGLVVTLFFPPVGLWILTGAAIAGGVYLVGRLSTPLFKSLGNWLVNKFKHPSATDESDIKEHLTNEHTLEEEHIVDTGSLLTSREETLNQASAVNESDSTAVVLIGLMGKEGAIEYSECLVEKFSATDSITEMDNGGFSAVTSPLRQDMERVEDTEDEGEGEAVTEHPENP